MSNLILPFGIGIALIVFFINLYRSELWNSKPKIRQPREFYNIKVTSVRSVAVTFAIAVLVAFIAGYAFSYWRADFTMSDAQARAYCTPQFAEDDLTVVQTGYDYGVFYDFMDKNEKQLYADRSESESKAFISGMLAGKNFKK